MTDAEQEAQRQRLIRSSEFQDLKKHPGYARFMEEARRMLASCWEGFLISDPSQLARLQAWAQGVRDVLAVVDDAAMDGIRVVQEQEAEAAKAREADEAHLAYRAQRTERGIRIGARI